MINAADMLALLAEATGASSLAIALVLTLRRPLRRHFGAAAGYGLWALVPATLVAVLLPVAAAAPVPMMLTFGNMGAQTLTTAAHTSVDYSVWLCAAWLLGVAAAGWRLASQQRAFCRALGAMQARGHGMFEADATAGLPAAIGLWRPMIVLPADFETRYTPQQRTLMQAHERMHIVRGDLQLNALVAVLRCLFWFNPLLHVAARAFRHDQELACDQRVLARHPQSRRAYGEAMFKTQLAAQPLPLGCHWLASHSGRGHPLKERIMMLKQPVPSSIRWISGATLVLALTAATGFAAWAAQPQAQRVIDDADAVPVEAVTNAASVSPESRMLNPPRYPATALEQRISGMVILIVDVAADGRPTGVAVEGAEPAGVFEAETAIAAWKWTFNPAIENGKPVAGRVRVPVEFRIPPEPATGGEANNS